MVVGLPAGTPLSVDLCMPDKACNGRNVRCTMLPLVITLTVPMLLGNDMIECSEQYATRTRHCGTTVYRDTALPGGFRHLCFMGVLHQVIPTGPHSGGRGEKS